jgi:hypothetical protein
MLSKFNRHCDPPEAEKQSPNPNTPSLQGLCFTKTRMGRGSADFLFFIFSLLIFLLAPLNSLNSQTLPTNPDSIPFAPAVNIPTGYHPIGLFCADLDRDEDLDLAVTNTWADSVSILINNGDGTFQNPVNYEVVGEPFSVFCADLDDTLART